MDGSMSTSGVIDPRRTPASIPAAGVAKDIRSAPPPLPRPICWTSLTHSDIFKEYISAEGLGQRGSSFDTPSVATGETLETTQDTQEPLSKNYPKHIASINADVQKLVPDVPLTGWIQHLFKHLHVPFCQELVSENEDLWVGRNLGQFGDYIFREPLDLKSEEKAAEWCNSVARSLGVIHGLLPSTNSTDQASGNDQSNDKQLRVFDYGGCNRPLSGGYLLRKPDLALIDRTTRSDLGLDARIRWPLVQALVEVSVRSNHIHAAMKTLISKASVIFESQLHRRFVLGLAFYGKGDDVKFSFALIDRAGGLYTKPCHLKGYKALDLAHIIFAFTFGSDELLGFDTRVTISRFTGDPIAVVIDNQPFTIVREIHSSPYLFGRGTRVYIVKDTLGHFHIFKDSWIISTHENSEIEHIKKISSVANAEGLTDIRSRFLRPRFVAGENHVNDTNEPRGLTGTRSLARIRRRIVTGPIGDPITSYRSRVECLQALIDIVNREC